ncbi:MAG: cyclic pyranopterin monophosphate synthase MoaC, partial [bacterium]
MKDITHKRKTLRRATATARLDVGDDALKAIENDNVPKGDPYRIAQTAALAGVKKTPELIPHCHSIGVDNMTLEFDRDGSTITVTVTAEATEKTG